MPEGTSPEHKHDWAELPFYCKQCDATYALVDMPVRWARRVYSAEGDRRDPVIEGDGSISQRGGAIDPSSWGDAAELIADLGEYDASLDSEPGG